MIEINFWYILLAVFVFGFLIFVHELGHFLSARAFGVEVKEFAIGMGPRIGGWTSKKNGIRYSIRLLPIGGYVDMVGEDEESESESAFNNKPVWQRILVVLAGPFMNLLLGLIAMGIMVSTLPNLGSTVITYQENAAVTSPSMASGLCEGDKILKVGRVSVHTGNELRYEIMRQGIEPIDILVEREGEKKLLEDVVFITFEEDGIVFGDLDFKVYAEKPNVGNIIKHTFWRSISTAKTVVDAVVDLIMGKYGIEVMAGPVGMTQIIGDSVANGVSSFLNIFVFITINLGMFNLFPIPALDGGRLVFLLWEAITRRPLNRNVEGYIQFVGLILMLILAAVVMVQDVIRLF